MKNIILIALLTASLGFFIGRSSAHLKRESALARDNENLKREIESCKNLMQASVAIQVANNDAIPKEATPHLVLPSESSAKAASLGENEEVPDSNSSVADNSNPESWQLGLIPDLKLTVIDPIGLLPSALKLSQVFASVVDLT